MSDLNQILKQIINLQASTIQTIKETVIIKETKDVEGYLRKVIISNITVQSGYWYICTTSGLTLTLPTGNTGNYIRFSTNYLAENVVIKPADGETIDGDSEGFTLDKASGTVEMLWIGSEWTVIEAK